MPTYIGSNPASAAGVANVRDEFVEASRGLPQAVLMPAKPVPTVAKGPKGKRAAGVSPARATVSKKRKSADQRGAPPLGTQPMQLPPLPPGGVRPPNCKYRKSYPLPQQPQQPQPTQTRRRRTVEDFLTFCKMILDYENYTEEQEEDRKRHSSSPLGSTGSSSGSGWDPVPPPPPQGQQASSELTFKKGGEVDDPSSSPLPSSSSPEHATEDDEATNEAVAEVEDGWNSVTCFCKKPFAGRPMIECSNCLTWVHLKCAKLSRKKIPDKWFCQSCRRDVVSPSPPSSQAKAKGHKATNGANKAKSSPTKPLAGARKRKSSLTSKRVVVITDTSSPPVTEDQAGVAGSSPNRHSPHSPSSPVTSPPSCGDALGRGEWLPRQEVAAAGDS